MILLPSSWMVDLHRFCPSSPRPANRSTRFSQSSRSVLPRVCCRSRATANASIQRQFNALFGTTVAYKPFYNQLAKRSFKDFMRAVLDLVLQQWVVGVLQPTVRGPLGEFGRILIQDGCSFAVKDALREHYPGRFKKQNPAAVELHVTMSLLDESVERVAVTADKAPERPHLPSPEALRGDLLLADRGYFDRKYFGAVNEAGGYFVARASASVNPKVRGAYTWEGGRWGRRGQDLRTPVPHRRVSRPGRMRRAGPDHAGRGLPAEAAGSGRPLPRPAHRLPARLPGLVVRSNGAGPIAARSGDGGEATTVRAAMVKWSGSRSGTAAPRWPSRPRRRWTAAHRCRSSRPAPGRRRRGAAACRCGTAASRSRTSAP